jgi:hypothetical protein
MFDNQKTNRNYKNPLKGGVHASRELPGAPAPDLSTASNGQAAPVKASGTPAHLCTFRPAIAARPRERPQPPATRTGRRRTGPPLSHPTAAPCSGE